MTIDEQCAAAMKRIIEWINRSAAQHKLAIRRMAKKQRTVDWRFNSPHTGEKNGSSKKAG